MINVLVAANERFFLIEGMMRDTLTRLYTDEAFDNKIIKLNRANNTIQIDDDVYIRFCAAEEDNIRGHRPDYFWTDSKDAENYLTAVGSKKLVLFSELMSVMKKGE